jgi:DNA-directed RNA polymerase specialized sigma24 family protein
MEALAQLPVEQREVIVLRVWHRYTFEEIAELQQASPNTVSGRYRYGIDKLRKSLKSNIYEDRNEQFGDAFAFLGAPASLREP